MTESKKNIKHRRQVLGNIAKRTNIADEVIEAMNRVPRQLFVDEKFEPMAYDDKPLPIEAGQTISQIYTVAVQTNLLKLQAGDSVLEIGTGSGYQTAILFELGYRVYSIERHEVLYLEAKQNLDKLGYDATLIYGDGFIGLPDHAPFNAILLTCGAPDIPGKLIEQLKINGKMVAPIGVGMQEMMVVHKVSENKTRIIKEGTYRFVPMLSGKVDAK